MKLAFFCNNYPVDSTLGGIGLRILELSQVLSKNHEIIIVTSHHSDFNLYPIKLVSKTENQNFEILEWCEAAFFSDMPDYKLLLQAHKLNKIIICDNAVPLEQIGYNEVKTSSFPDFSYKLLVKIFELQVLVSDIFVTRAKIERTTLLSALALAGRFNCLNFETSSTLNHMVFDVPIGFNLLSEQHKKKVSSTKLSFDYIWSGGVWDFYDACAVIKAVAAGKKNKNDSLKIKFMYPLIKDGSLKEPIQLLKLISDYNISDLVSISNEYIVHYSRDHIIQSGRALISLSKPGIENETCHRLRLRDVFLYEMPIIVDSYGATGEFVRNTGIGLAVDTIDPVTILNNMVQLISDKSLYMKCIQNIKIHRVKHIYDNSLIMLEKRLEKKVRSPDVNFPENNRNITSLLEEISWLEMQVR